MASNLLASSREKDFQWLLMKFVNWQNNPLIQLNKFLLWFLLFSSPPLMQFKMDKATNEVASGSIIVNAGTSFNDIINSTNVVSKEIDITINAMKYIIESTNQVTKSCKLFQKKPKLYHLVPTQLQQAPRNNLLLQKKYPLLRSCWPKWQKNFKI